MKSIIFLVKDPSCGASFACGNMVKVGLETYDIESEILYYDEINIDDIKNSIVTIFKHSLPTQDLITLKKNNNKIIIDVVDEFIRPQTDVTDLYDYSLFDGVISRVKKVLDEYSFHPHLELIYLPLHWDIRFQDLNFNPTFNPTPVCIANDLRDVPHIQYLFANKKVDFIINLGVEAFSDPKMIDTFSQYSIHYNIRETNSIAYKFKPATKLITAAAFNTPIITNYDWALQDLIPQDYPFLVQDTSLNNIINFIDNIKDILKDKWEYSLDIMKEVKYKTSLINLIPQYIEFYSKF
jgi:hypothetical protein